MSFIKAFLGTAGGHENRFGASICAVSWSQSLGRSWPMLESSSGCFVWSKHNVEQRSVVCSLNSGATTFSLLEQMSETGDDQGLVMASSELLMAQSSLVHHIISHFLFLIFHFYFERKRERWKREIEKREKQKVLERERDEPKTAINGGDAGSEGTHRFLRRMSIQ